VLTTLLLGDFDFFVANFTFGGFTPAFMAVWTAVIDRRARGKAARASNHQICHTPAPPGRLDGSAGNLMGQSQPIWRTWRRFIPDPSVLPAQLHPQPAHPVLADPLAVDLSHAPVERLASSTRSRGICDLAA